MTLARRSRAAALALALALAGLAAMAIAEHHDRDMAAAAAGRPKLALLTSLPLLFGEQFASPPPRLVAVDRLQRHFTLVPIAVADRASLAGFALLLMAHPRAQPAQALVELDSWVRGGGHLVLLADPRLDWDSSRPLGDPLRPPPDFADTGLLAHWGLRLVPGASDGRLVATAANCAVGEGGLVARCRVGGGSASVIADADFIMGEGAEPARRLDLLLGQLEARDSR